MDEMKQQMAEQFSTIVQKGMYSDADEMLSQLRETVNPNEYLSEDLCITAAFLYNRLDKKEIELYYLQQGFLINPSNPSLFISLADYYSKTNVVQELICLYQALYQAERTGSEEQVSFITQIIAALENNQVRVPKTSIVILSYNTLDYLKQCLDSVKNTIPLKRCQVIVVDNASTDGSLEYLRSLDWITLVENHENRGFPGGCNDGIAAAEDGNDIWLLNSDTIVPENALFWLKIGLYESDNTGSCGSISNFAANGQNVEVYAESIEDYLKSGEKFNVPQEYPYVFDSYLVGFSLLLKRSALDKIGLLDERFFPGNGEDVDLGLRMVHEGYLNRLCVNSFVFHYGNKSFDKLLNSLQDYADLSEETHKKLIDKLGFDQDTYFNNKKPELFEEIKTNRDAKLNILEIDCGLGQGAANIKTMFPNVCYVGTELNAKAASYAKVYGDVYVTDIDTMDLPEKYSQYFDYIILGDALQFSADPKAVLEKLSGFLKTGGKLILSISNLRHYSVLLPLLSEGRFSYTDNGVIKRGMRTLFTENEAARLISANGYIIKDIKPLAGDKPSIDDRKLLNSGAELLDQPDIEDFLTKEYIFAAEKMH